MRFTINSPNLQVGLKKDLYIEVIIRNKSMKLRGQSNKPMNSIVLSHWGRKPFRISCRLAMAR